MVPPLTARQRTSIERRVARWARAYAKAKKLEAASELERDAVLAALREVDRESFDSKFGKISLQKRSTTNYEQLARSVLRDEVVDGIKEKFTTMSEPFIRAPQGFAGKR